MAQFGRPIGDITVTNITGTPTNTAGNRYQNIDESTASDTDYVYGANNTVAEYECSLTASLTDPSSSSGHTFRYRIARTNAGTVDGGGNAVTVTARLMQGTTQIAADAAETATGSWVEYSYTLTSGEADAITDYTDLRLEFVTSASGGSPANRRGAAVSWAELEIPDAPSFVTRNVHGQAEASIKQIYDVHAQAQSWIEQTYNIHAQANADILQIYNVHGQAQSQILQTYFVVAQAQADIKQIYFAHSQAQGTIKSISNAFGQANCSIKQTYPFFGQAQAFIVYKRWAHGQAQAKIADSLTSQLGISASIPGKSLLPGYNAVVAQEEAFTVVHGQAQANIEQTYNVHGQAQSQIKQTYNTHGQSQAQINQTYFAHGQAQGSILTTYYVHGQAQAWIKTTYFVHAQAQAQLGALYQAYAQAQGTILQTYYVHGQAQGQIKTTYNVHGQSQGTIVNTYFVHGQSQAYIKATVNSHGQSQGTILTTYRIHAQAQAQIPGTGTRVYGQAQGYIFRPVAQAQGIILTTYSTSGQARGFVIAIRRYMSQAQGTIARYNLNHGQSQAFILDRTFEGLGQARAFIHYSMGFAQAQAYLLTGYLLFDTFTRTTPVADINYPDHGPEYDEYFNGLYTTSYYQVSYVDGTQLVTSGNGNYEWVNTVNRINAKNATSQIDIKISQLSDWITVVDLGLRVNNTYGNRVGGTVYYNPDDDRMDAYVYDNLAGAVVQIPTISGGEWYTAKFYADNADIKLKFWKRSDPEPGTWLVEDTTAWLEVGAASFYQDMGETPTPTYGYADNYNVFGTIYTPYSIQQSGQARAQIKRTFRAHAQARAKIATTAVKHAQAQGIILVINDTDMVLAIQDTFTRTTSLGVLGTPDFGSYYVTQPQISFSNVDGQKLVTTGTDYDYVETIADISTSNTITAIDFMFPQLTDFMTVGLHLRADTDLSPRIRTLTYYEPGLYMVLRIFGSSVVGVDTTYPTITPNVWYTIKFEAMGIDVRVKVWERDTTEPDWMLETTIVGIPTTGGVGYYQDVGEGATVSVYLDNFNAYEEGVIPPQAYGQAQGYIVTTLYRIPGQAQAYILKPVLYGQAQANIKRTNRSHGQAQAFINKFRSYGQAQAWVWLTSRVVGNAAARIVKGQPSGQAQARIYAFGQRAYGQSMAQIRATVITYGHGQANCLIKGPATGQAAALIGGSAKYLVRFNGYDLPGYAQQETIDSVSRMSINNVPYLDGALSQYVGLENKIISLKMKVIGQDYLDVKLQAQKAATIVRTSRDFTKLYIQYWDRYFEVLTKKISIDKSVGASMRALDYTVEFEAKPWLTSVATYTISGVGLINTDQVARGIYNGGWTPANLRLSGTNITVSGYTSTGEYAGFISISGAVSNFEINSKEYEATNNSNMNNADYIMYVGPGKTYFQISGATDCVITWNDRWYL